MSNWFIISLPYFSSVIDTKIEFDFTQIENICFPRNPRQQRLIQ